MNNDQWNFDHSLVLHIHTSDPSMTEASEAHPCADSPLKAVSVDEANNVPAEE